MIIAGGGLAGLVTAYELLGLGKRVLVLEKGRPEGLGGLARESFGGIHLIGTRQQRRMGIRDDAQLAYRDWARYAEFGSDDHLPRAWAKLYCDSSRELIEDFLTDRGIQFLPLVNWPERGMFRVGNSVPRWHIAWGTGREIVSRLIAALERHPRRSALELKFEHEVDGLQTEAGRVVGLTGRSVGDGRPFEARAEQVVIASGGICGGDLSKVRANWYGPWGPAPRYLLNGAHSNADGKLQDRAAELGARLTHLDLHWHYAAGIHHPARRRPHDGLSLVPPRSALWLNAKGERIGPVPLVGYTDTRWLVERILAQPGQYSWQLMNWKIAIRELAVSGCDYMDAFRERNRLRLLRELVFGSKTLVRRLIQECGQDIVVAQTPEELVDGMNARSLDGLRVDGAAMTAAAQDYDAEIDRGRTFFVDEQLRRLAGHRAYRADRWRLTKFQKILDPRARPLIAIREFILTRKSLGGLQTDLACRVLRTDGSPLPGLYAVGEAAGFGGGGIHGLRSLEGTFLGSCVLTGRTAARAIAAA